MFNINSIPVNKFLVIGSFALQTRPSGDIDIVCFKEDIQISSEDILHTSTSTLVFKFGDKKIECLLADSQPSFQVLLAQISELKSVASFQLCYAIKKAHIYRQSHNWDRHILDYSFLSKMFPNDGVIVPELANLNISIKEFSALHEDTLNLVLGKNFKIPLKNITKDQFFDNAVTEIVEHDWLHQIYAHLEQPIYTYLQDDPQIVYCNPYKWSELSFEHRVMCVLEECYVIATERFLIKKIIDGVAIEPLTYRKSFLTALYKVCTTLTSGFFRQFAIDNYFLIVNTYNKNYIQPLLDSYNNGRIIYAADFLRASRLR
jgi:hypothetical protein